MWLLTYGFQKYQIFTKFDSTVFISLKKVTLKWLLSIRVCVKKTKLRLTLFVFNQRQIKKRGFNYFKSTTWFFRFLKISQKRYTFPCWSFFCNFWTLKLALRHKPFIVLKQTIFLIEICHRHFTQLPLWSQEDLYINKCSTTAKCLFYLLDCPEILFVRQFSKLENRKAQI